MKTWDLIVVGGGPSGVAAAITAAEKGLRVLLIEKSNALGGAANINLVNPFMPYWTKNGQEKDLLSRGFFTRLTEELRKANAISPKDDITFDEEAQKLILNRMAAAAGVELLFNATVIGAKKEGDRLVSVTVYGIGKTYELSAARFIDATGDGNLAALCGVPFELGRKEDGLCQPMTLCFRVGNLHPERYPDNLRQYITSRYQELQLLGKIQNPRENVLMFQNLCPTVKHFNTTRIIRRDPTDLFDVTAAELEAREQVNELVEMLRRDIPGFEDAVLLSTAASIGVRESRRILGRHLLTEEELKACTVFPDCIATANYDIDIHNPNGSGTSHYYFPDGQYYTIPYRSLVPESGAENLLVSGRCISATHEAQASIRVMPICSTLGEAAGLAAVVAQRHDLPFAEIPVEELQELLLANGARIR